ncbi:uncharacterized protein VP01_263g2 [Puccinia sorghi]|uniref:Uncharacterized protein n=1 Tax=Puccinia sorghi TaxID=27349 RepID=A0A0L6V487_9BASI|nr:uncharacterized protein VP01_263g2 [Puccinia sorghi]
MTSSNKSSTENLTLFAFPMTNCSVVPKILTDLLSKIQNHFGRHPSACKSSILCHIHPRKTVKQSTLIRLLGDTAMLLHSKLPSNLWKFAYNFGPVVIQTQIPCSLPAQKLLSVMRPTQNTREGFGWTKHAKRSQVRREVVQRCITYKFKAWQWLLARIRKRMRKVQKLI